MGAALLLYFAVVIAALVCYYVRSAPGPFLLAYCSCYYEALYALALFPQLWMFQKDKQVPQILAKFVVLIALGRVCIFIFWLLYPVVHPRRLPANRNFQMGSEAVNLMILSDFLFYWGRAKLFGHKHVVLMSDSFSSFV